jgi:hypothetical protein
MSNLIYESPNEVKGKSPGIMLHLKKKLTGAFPNHIAKITYIKIDIIYIITNPSRHSQIRHFQQIMTERVEGERMIPVKAMVQNSQIALLHEISGEHSLSETLFQSRVEDDVKLGLMFLFQFNRDLDRNAKLSRLNEQYLEQRMEELDEHVPICKEVYEHTRARLHELLLLCAANYANNCEYSAVGDLMFNPRITLVHIRGCHEPVVKERHTPLSEQFRDRAGRPTGVVKWLREEATLEVKKKPLIPYSYEILESCSFISKTYLDSARDRAVQIADLSAFLCCRGFEDRLFLEDWLRSASQSDKNLMNSRFIELDWKLFWELGSSVRVLAYEQGSQRAVPSIEETVVRKKLSDSGVAAF